MRQVLLFCIIILIELLPNNANAYLHSFPENLAPEVLSEQMPTAFRYDEFTGADFELLWKGPEITGAKFHIGTDSIQWVRIIEVLALPRGRLIFSIPDIEKGQLQNAGFTQPIVVDPQGIGHAELPIALLSGQTNLVKVVVYRKGKRLESSLELRFKPKDPAKSSVYLDASCSPYSIEIKNMKLTNSWAYIGCRYLHNRAEEGTAASLETFVYWDGKTSVQVNDVPTASTSAMLWPVRLRNTPGKITFQDQSETFDYTYKISENSSYIFKGLIAGLSHYNIRGSGSETTTAAPVLKFYIGYILSETVKIYTLNFAYLNSQYYFDSGLYLMSNDIQVLDKRIVFRIILGMHVLAFKPAHIAYARFNANQGAELEFTDILKRGHNLKIGAFFYPKFSNRFFLGSWIRWGTPSLYGELQYINWEENAHGSPMYQTSTALSIGFPFSAIF